MNSCRSFRMLLPGYEAGDLTRREQAGVAKHLAGCDACAAENRKFQAIRAALRPTSIEEYSLPAGERRRIAAEAASRRGSASWLLWLSFFPMARPHYVLAAAGALAIALSLPVYFNTGRGTPPDGGVSEVRVVADHGVVHLAWSDGRKGVYTVTKSRDPQGLMLERAFVVHGNAWTDLEADASPVVFYRIE